MSVRLLVSSTTIMVVRNVVCPDDDIVTIGRREVLKERTKLRVWRMGEGIKEKRGGKGVRGRMRMRVLVRRREWRG